MFRKDYFVCNPASFVLTRHNVFWSRQTDSHENIIEEFKLHQDGAGSPNIVRVEISPPNGNLRLPLSEWIYKLDYVLDDNTVPEWYDSLDCQIRARAALADWAAAKLVIDRAVEIRSAQVYALGEAKVTAHGSSDIAAFDNACVYAHDSSSVYAHNKSTVCAYDISFVEAFDAVNVSGFNFSRVNACDNCDVVANDACYVVACSKTTVRAADDVRVYATGNSRVEAKNRSTVHATGQASVCLSGRSIATLYDTSVLTGCRDEATAICYCKQSVQPMSPMAVIIDRSCDEEAICHVGRKQEAQDDNRIK